MLSPGTIGQFRHHPQTILLITCEGIRVQLVLRFKLTELKARPTVAHSMAQHAQSSISLHRLGRRIEIGLAQLSDYALAKSFFRILGVELAVFFPLRLLGRLDKTE